MYGAFHLFPLVDCRCWVKQSTYLDIRKIRLHNPIHHTPNIRNGILVLNPNIQLIPHKRPRTLPTKEILGTNRLSIIPIYVLQVHSDGVLALALILKPGNRPRPLHFNAILGQVIEKHALNVALVQQRREGIPRIDELGTASPCACAGDARARLTGVPEGDFVDAGGLV